MSDNAVREQLQRYVDDVTPTRLPPFERVGVRRRRQRLRRLSSAGVTVVLAVAAVLGGFAFSGSSGTSPAARTETLLAGTSWRLTAVTDPSGTWTAPPDTRWFVQFSAHAYAGSDGCNSVSGTVDYGASTVTLVDGVSTAMACIDAGLDRPRRAFSALEGHQATVALSGQSLTLTVGTTTLTLASRGAVPGPSLKAALIGPRWMLRSITVGGKAVPTANDYGASLTFADNAYKVDDGCNTGNGSVGYLNDTVVMTAGSQTAAFCADRRTVTDEEKYAGAYTVQVDGTVLTLTGANRHYVFDAQGHAAFASQLVGTDWRLVSWRRHGSQFQVAAGTRAGISFEVGPDRYVSLSDGCNTDTGNALYKGAHVKLQNGQVSTKVCSNSDARIMGAFRTALDSDVSAGVTTTTLSLSGNGVYLILERSTAKYDLPSPVTTAPTASAETPLVGPTFMLRKLTVNGTALPRAEAIGATVTWTESSVAADDGCNDLGGSVRYEGETIVPAADISSSAMGCPDPHFEQVALPFDNLLRSRSTVVRHADGITITAGGTVAELAVEAPADLTRDTLAGSWHVVSVSTSAGVAARPVNDPAARLTFAGGAFRLEDGCNTMTGTVTYGPVSLTFEDEHESAIPCAATTEVATLRDALRTVIQGETSYEHEGGGVWLRVGDTSVGLAPVLS